MSEDNKLKFTRRSFINTAAISGAALALHTPAVLANTKNVMKIAHAEGLDSPITQSLEAWTKRINELSGGEIDAQHFPAGQLGGFSQLTKLVQQGAIQATVGGPSAWADFEPALNVVDLGFMFDNEAHVDRVYQGELGQRISQLSRDNAGVDLVAYGEVGFRHLFTREPVTKLADLAGKKLRVPQMKYWIDFWNALGANATPLPYNEQYTALSAGVIDGNETDVHSILSFKWFEQAKHFTQTNHWFLVKAVAVNGGFMQGLPADLQAVVRESAQASMEEQRASNRGRTSEATEQAVANGVELHDKPSDIDEWVAKVEPLIGEYREKSTASAELLDEIVALRG